MKKAMLVLLVLAALVSGAEAIGFTFGKESFFDFWDDDGTAGWSRFSFDDKFALSSEEDLSMLGIVFPTNEGKDRSCVLICLVYVYIFLTPIEFVGLILLIITLLIIGLVVLSKKTKQNEEEQGAKQ